MGTPRSNSPNAWVVERVVETGSTNTDLLARASDGAPHGSVLVADHQTAGRGRLDRVWTAPPGANLLVSLLFRGGFDPGRPHELTQRVGVAAIEAIERLSLVRPVLKWPNDVLVDEVKVAGILAQAAQAANGVTGAAGAAQAASGVTGAAGAAGAGAGVMHVVVGIGVNLGWAPDGAARVDGVDRDALLDALLDRIDARWSESIASPYRDRLATLGQRVRVERPNDILLGTAVDVEAGGELLVRDDDGVEHAIAAGDVVHLRPA